jgi:16S rRNA (cytidine1402-2'-O)-methyltransferase
MPTISDPGERLVRACAQAGIPVRVVPGPSAVVAALAVSGLATERFVFEGFLPRRVGERRARLATLAGDPRTLVLFESPNRVAALLRDVLDVLGDRRAAIARELTKRHEEVRRGRVSELLEGLGDGRLRGEVVVVLEGGVAEPPSRGRLLDEARSLVAGGLRLRAAARAVAERHGVPANELYRALAGSTRSEEPRRH